MTSLRERAAELARTEAQEIAEQALAPAIASMVEMTAAASKAAQQTAENTRQAGVVYSEARNLLRTTAWRLHLQSAGVAILLTVLILGSLLLWKRDLLLTEEERGYLDAGRDLVTTYQALPQPKQEELMEILGWSSPSRPTATPPSRSD